MLRHDAPYTSLAMCVQGGMVKPLVVFGWHVPHLERGHQQQEAAAGNTFRPSHHPVAIGTLATLRQTYRRENPTVQYAFETFVLNVFAIRTN